jgi:LPXTG-motif cell wall-anchored protein
MEKVFLTLAGSGGKAGITVLYILIALAIIVITGFFLLRKKKK